MNDYSNIPPINDLTLGFLEDATVCRDACYSWDQREARGWDLRELATFSSDSHLLAAYQKPNHRNLQSTSPSVHSLMFPYIGAKDSPHIGIDAATSPDDDQILQLRATSTDGTTNITSVPKDKDKMDILAVGLRYNPPQCSDISELTPLPVQNDPPLPLQTQSSSQYHQARNVVKNQENHRKERGSRNYIHNAVEKRYRRGLNDKMEILRDVVPSVRIALKRKRHETILADDLRELNGLQEAAKISKHVILEKAVEYIQHLQEQCSRLEDSRNQAKYRQEALENYIAAKSNFCPASLPDNIRWSSE